MSTVRKAPPDLLRWSLRSHLLGAVALGAGTGLLHLVTAPAYAAAGRLLPGGLARVAADAAPLAKSLEVLTGPADRLDTIAGYISYKVFPTTALMFAIYAAVQGTRALRGAEQDRLSDLWLAAGLSRRQVLGRRAAAFAAMLALAVALMWTGTAAGAGLAGEEVLAPAALQSAALLGVALTAYALGIVLSQLLASARVALAAATGWMVAGYVVANAGDQLGPLSFLRWLSPFTGYLRARALVPAGSVSATALVALAGGIVALLAAAAALEDHRDVDAGILRRRVPAAATTAFTASRLLRRGLWAEELSAHWVMAAAWFAGIAGFTAIEAGLAPQALRILDEAAGSQVRAIHDLTISTYLTAVVALAALLGCGVALHLGGRWVSDAGHRRDEGVLSAPVGWSRFVGARAAVLLTTGAVVVGAATVTGLGSGDALGGTAISAGGLARVGLVLTLLTWAVGGIALALATALRSMVAVVVTGAVVLVSSLLATVVPLAGWPSWAAWPSLLQAAGEPYTALPGIGSLLYLSGLGVVGTLVAVALMRSGSRIAA